MKKLLTLLTLLVCAITGAWADTTYNMVDRSGATPTLTSNFRVDQDLTLDGSNNPIEFEGNSLLGYVKCSGTQSAITGTTDFKKHFAYEVKSTATHIKLYVYNTNSSGKELYISEIKEGDTSEAHKTTKTVASKTATILEYETTNTKNSTIFFYVNSTNIQIYQIEAVESGTPLPTGGEPGYELNLNKGRACVKSSTLGKVDNIDLYLSSDYKPCSSTEARIKSKGTNYIKFMTTVATEVSVNVSTTKTYYISSTIDATEVGVSSYTTNATKTIPAGIWYIVPNGDEVKVTKLSFAASELYIKTHPVSATYTTGATATALTVEAQGGTAPYTYQWYSCTDAEKTGATAISGATSASYTPPTAATGYYYCKVTDSATPTAAVVESDVATITVSAAAAPAFTSVTPSETSVQKGTASTIEAVVTGNPAPTIQWYSNTTASNEGGTVIDGATALTLNLANTAIGTFYYYAVATNSVSSVASAVQTITVTGSTACKLYEAKYSNGFNAFIDENAKTVTVYYLEGEAAPTVSSTDKSADATVNTADASQIVVTAEDETTTATYTVTRTAVTPYAGDGVQFDGTETWVKTGNAYFITNNDKTYYAWVINRQLKNTENRDDDARVALGKTRIYFFVDAAYGIKLTNDRGTALNTARNIKVYVNGEQQASPTSMGAYNAEKNPSITITTGNVPAMIEISSNQNSGDTGWGKIEIINNKSIDVSAAKWASVTTPGWAVDFDANADVYIATAIDDNVKLTKITDAPANTPVVVNAPSGSYTMTPKAAATTDVTGNKLKSSDGSVTGNYVSAGNVGDYYVLGMTGGQIGFAPLASGVVLAAGKAYIPATEFASAKEFYPFVSDGEESGETDGIAAMELQHTQHSAAYNLAGQKVDASYKGIVIVNGKKVKR